MTSSLLVTRSTPELRRHNCRTMCGHFETLVGQNLEYNVYIPFLSSVQQYQLTEDKPMGQIRTQSLNPHDLIARVTYVLLPEEEVDCW